MASQKTAHIDLSTIDEELVTVKYKWWDIGLKLRVPYHKLKEFEGERNPFVEVMNYWLNRNIKDVPVTWRSIVTVLESSSVNERDLAKAIMKKYCEPEPSSIEDSPTLDPADTKMSGTYTSSGSSSLPPPVELAGYFPYLPKDGSMSEEERLQHLSKLYRESEKIKTRFTFLMINLQKDLEKKGKLEDAINVLIFYESNLLDELNDCNSVPLLFRKIRRFVSFFDYKLLKILAKYFGSSEVKEKFKKYKLHFQEFAKRHICEYPSDLFAESVTEETAGEKPQKTYVLKIDESVERLTLEDLKKLKRKMNEILGQKFLKVVEVKEGCVQVVFGTFCHDEFVISKQQQKALSKLNVLTISCGSESVQIPTTLESKDSEQNSDSGFHADGDSNFITQTEESSVISDLKTKESHPESISYSLFKVKDLVDPRIDMMLSAKKQKVPFTPLHVYTILGDLEQVKSMVEGGINPLDTDINNDTLLHFAAQHGSLDILKYLVEEVACNPAEGGSNGTTVLHAAAGEGQLHVVKYLAEDCSMEVTTPDAKGRYPLHHACCNGNLEAVQYLIHRMQEYKELVLPEKDRTFPPENSESIECLGKALRHACEHGNLSTAKYLIENISIEPSIKGQYNLQAIHYAATCGKLEVVKYLLEEQSCDVFALDDGGWNPLCLASYHGHLEVVRYLILQQNCNPMTVYSDAVGNCLYVASSEERLDILSFLIKDLKCDVCVKLESSHYPIHRAAETGDLKLFRFFVEELDCDPLSVIEGEDMYWSTLHAAAAGGSLSVVKYLLETRKCDPMIGHDHCNTALHVAAIEGYLHILQYLIEEVKMEKNFPDFQGRTVLNLAALQGHLPCVKYLLALRCEHYNDKHQRTPLHDAAAGGHLDIVKYLMDCHSNWYSLSPSTSPLHLATQHGQLNIVKYFIEDKKCDPYVTGKHGDSLLHTAAQYGQTEMVKYFVQDIKLNHMYMMQNDLTFSPLHYAAKNGYIETFNYFISELKCDINMPMALGYLPIHVAVMGGQLSFIEYLLKQPTCDVMGYSRGSAASSLHMAARHGKLDIVQRLTAVKEIDPFDPEPMYKDTPLHSAATFNKLDVVKFYVSTFGSRSLLVKNSCNQTPLDVALKNNSVVCALYLTVKTFEFMHL